MPLLIAKDELSKAFDAALSLIIWDEKKQAYIYEKTKRIVSAPILKKHLDARLERYYNKGDRLVTQLLNKQISFENWQKETAQVIKKAHLELLRFGRGGTDKTYAIHYLFVAQELKLTQYKHFREDLATQIKAGTQTENIIRNRVKNYIDSATTSYEFGRASYRITGGANSYERHLGNCKIHCQPCIYYASLGRLPIDNIVYPGQHCDCFNNCRCSLSFSVQPADGIAANKLAMYLKTK